MAELITLVRVVCTSLACPSQWDAWDDQGRYHYLRYRHGVGSAERAGSEDAWNDAWKSAHWDEETLVWHGLEAIEQLASFEYVDENGWDGEISLETFCEKAGFRLADTVERVAYWRNIANQLAEEFKDEPAALAYADQLLGGTDLDME